MKVFLVVFFVAILPFLFSINADDARAWLVVVPSVGLQLKIIIRIINDGFISRN